MPELPEVEAARRLAERSAVGKLIASAVVADDDSECRRWRLAPGAATNRARWSEPPAAAPLAALPPTPTPTPTPTPAAPAATRGV
jgi:hypothetical protein